MRHKIKYGDCLDIMARMDDESIDAICSDTPYGIGFMNRAWDKTVPGQEYWEQAIRICKPGAHALLMGGARTHHRLACAVEDAGWEIRDCLFWVYLSGFCHVQNIALAIDKQAGATGHRGKAIVTANHPSLPGSQKNLVAPKGVPRYEPITEEAKKWDGWFTGLTPSVEPIILARKPFKGTVAANVIKYGTGALNIDTCRIGDEPVVINRFTDGAKPWGGASGHPYVSEFSSGRWPKNLILSEEAAAFIDTQREGASKLFFVVKANKKERELGLEDLPTKRVSDGREKAADNPYQRGKTERKNTVPTVKPIELGQYLIRLITPPGGVVLDPFVGSGTFIMAAKIEGFSGIGIEKEIESVRIARKRVAAVEINK